ncbi:MAG: glycosyl transferase [Candidatus Portnoybacteria bacterium RBG_19FT_COMBO_36_7]|uniref:Glycosyl transferase n=1 Tax=Candidatus Portnoybacteria bacterium RBG_19FT_COMBO_36_7 TaxID=1801992 RepID=A0A1G2F8F2_9BACT|nr:MAG: glycosyl transferase [Candidatus Portnoybacteria bacterium RBG_19FT_COMBO_36_7]
MRVALVHDYLNQYGGAERVLEAFCEIWPDAPIFTLIYDRARTGQAFDGRRIKTSFLQKIPFVRSHHRPFLMLMPLAIESFDFSKYDLVISDSASFAKGIITRPSTLHICYCHTPTRYAWDDSHKYIREFGYPSFVRSVIPIFMNYLRVWDQAAAERPDKFIANSEFVASRIQKYYQKKAVVIHPPVNAKLFYVSPQIDRFFLIVARLLSYKRLDIAIGAFNRLGLPLKIVGDGPDSVKLRRLAGPNIEFLGLVADFKLRELYAKCQAFIFPQEEDFGITALEAMASGRPVIAYQAGGALETIKHGVSGLFFKEQTVESLISSLKQFVASDFNPQVIREQAMQFDKEIFKQKIKDFVQNCWEEHKKIKK